MKKYPLLGGLAVLVVGCFFSLSHANQKEIQVLAMGSPPPAVSPSPTPAPCQDSVAPTVTVTVKTKNEKVLSVDKDGNKIEQADITVSINATDKSKCKVKNIWAHASGKKDEEKPCGCSESCTLDLGTVFTLKTNETGGVHVMSDDCSEIQVNRADKVHYIKYIGGSNVEVTTN